MLSKAFIWFILAGILALAALPGVPYREEASAQLNVVEIQPARVTAAQDTGKTLPGEQRLDIKNTPRPSPSLRGAVRDLNIQREPDPASSAPVSQAPGAVRPSAGAGPTYGASGAPAASGSLSLSVPRIGLNNIPVPTTEDQTVLDKEGIIHLPQTGFPSQAGSNTYIAGHAVGYAYSRLPYVFYDLDKLRPGDEIFMRDSTGKTYTYRVYESFIVWPEDYWVTYPIPGKTTITLQTCTPVPTFEKRLIVRGELVG